MGKRARKCVPVIENEIVTGCNFSVPKFCPPLFVWYRCKWNGTWCCFVVKNWWRKASDSFWVKSLQYHGSKLLHNKTWSTRYCTSNARVPSVHLRVAMYSEDRSRESSVAIYKRNADGMAIRLIQKMQEFDFRRVHRPGEKHCNANGLSRKPNEQPEWKKSEEEELWGQIREFQTMEKVLGGAQEDLNSGISSKRKGKDLIAYRMLIPNPPKEVVKCETKNFMESPSSLVLCAAGDIRVKSSPMTEFVVRYSNLRPTEDYVNRVGGTIKYWDSEQSRYIYLLMTKEE